MSIGPAAGVVASAAGAAAQAGGADVQRARQDAIAQQRAVRTALQAEDAAGIAQTDGQEHETNERDADGRRPWEAAQQRPNPEDSAASPDAPPTSRDASGLSGSQLDLTA
jgi:hypothetical protein